MSGFKKFFGTKKSPATDTKEAVKQLRETRDLLQKKSDYLEKKIEEELATAKRYGMKNKKMALKALARKKGFENQLQKIDNTLAIIDNQIDSIDNAGMNLEVFKVLKTTAGTMKTVHKNMKLDDIHDTMDDIMEQRDIAQEISDAISNPSAFGLEQDEDELLAELESLQPTPAPLEGLTAEDLENQLLDVGPSVSDLPNVPNKELPNPPSTSKAAAKPVADTSERDLNELMAWAE
ncbi:unnamed protein product [Calicophoron daubneyi]|uniref:Charged multivesicular body protein 4b n=1 Tax=Calicophoron daubneyi TaxID=300641 RepID=A0AAV2TDX5_CALDB